MSSTLPRDVIRAFDAVHRRSDGTYVCASCSKRIPRAKMNRDHIKPEHRGGSHSLDNLQPLCLPCHAEKTAAEARRRARKGRGGHYLAVATNLAGCALAIIWALAYWRSGFDWQHANQTSLHVARQAAFVALFVAMIWAGGTFVAWWWSLGGNGAAQPDSPPKARGEHYDVQRIIDGAREVMGSAGEVRVSAPAPSSFLLSYSGTGFDDTDEEKCVKVAARVSAKTGRRWEVKWHPERDEALFTERAPLPLHVDHPGFESMPSRPWHVLPFADDARFDLLSTAHILVQGATGSGKTSVMRDLIAAALDSASRDECDVILIDPKRVEYKGYRGSRNTLVHTGIEDIWRALVQLKAEVIRRYDAVDNDETTLEDLHPLIVVIDEFEHLDAECRELWTSGTAEREFKKVTGQTLPPPIAAVRSVLRLARTGRVHLIIGTQRADADYFGGRARMQLEGRIGVGRLDGDASRMCFASAQYGRDIPPDLKGRCNVQVGDGAVREVQAWWLPRP